MLNSFRKFLHLLSSIFDVRTRPERKTRKSLQGERGNLQSDRDRERTTMSTLKQKTIDHIIELEGGDKYTNDPDDSGGPTRWGVTEQTARAYGYEGDMRELPREIAFKIYSDMFWDKLLLDAVEDLSYSIAEEMADTAVNMGTYKAARFLQEGLNAFNLQQKFYPDLVVDGVMGGKTFLALEKYLQKRGVEGEIVLFRALNCLQGAEYIRLSQSRQKDEKYVYGWLLNRVS